MPPTDASAMAPAPSSPSKAADNFQLKVRGEGDNLREACVASVSGDGVWLLVIPGFGASVLDDFCARWLMYGLRS